MILAGFIHWHNKNISAVISYHPFGSKLKFRFMILDDTCNLVEFLIFSVFFWISSYFLRFQVLLNPNCKKLSCVREKLLMKMM